MYLGFPVTDKAGARAGVSRSWYSRYVISGCVPASSVVFPEGVSATRFSLEYWLQPTAIAIFTTEILFYFNTLWSFVKPGRDTCRKISSQLLNWLFSGGGHVYRVGTQWRVMCLLCKGHFRLDVRGLSPLKRPQDKFILANQEIIRQPMCCPDQRHSD